MSAYLYTYMFFFLLLEQDPRVANSSSLQNTPSSFPLFWERQLPHFFSFRLLWLALLASPGGMD